MDEFIKYFTTNTTRNMSANITGYINIINSVDVIDKLLAKQVAVIIKCVCDYSYSSIFAKYPNHTCQLFDKLTVNNNANHQIYQFKRNMGSRYN